MNYSPGNDQACFQHEFLRTIPPAFVLHLEDVYVTSEAVFERGRVVEESLTSPGLKNNFNFRYKASCLLKRKHVRLAGEHEYLLAYNMWSQNTFHWFCDVIPRIYAMRAKCSELILLLPDSHNTFHVPSLAPFQFKGIHFFSDKELLRVPRLVLPTHLAPTGNYNEEIIRKVRNVYRQHLDHLQHHEYGDLVYISRAKATRRRVINEEELIRVIGRYGFRTVHLEDYSFEEQFKIMSGARCVIAPHGAGLTSMIFMQEGSQVLELRRANDDTNLCYFSLASALNLPYFYQFCRRADANEDIWINTGDLTDTMKKMGII